MRPANPVSPRVLPGKTHGPTKGYFVRARRVSAACKSANGVNEPQSVDCLSHAVTASDCAMSSANGDTF
jgi:hypothetical protein